MDEMLGRVVRGDGSLERAEKKCVPVLGEKKSKSVSVLACSGPPALTEVGCFPPTHIQKCLLIW